MDGIMVLGPLDENEAITGAGIIGISVIAFVM